MSQPDLATDRPLLCVRCSYDLRGIDETGRCPECGSEIAESVAARAYGSALPLHLANRRWLNLVALGFTLLSCSLFAAYAWIGLALFTGSPPLIEYGIAIAPIPFALAGVVLTSLREPSAAAGSRLPGWLAVAFAVLAQLHFAVYVSSIAERVGVYTLFLLSTWSALFCTVLVFRQAHELARRLPSRSHVVQARVLTALTCVGALSLTTLRIVEIPNRVSSYVVRGEYFKPMIPGIGDDLTALAAVHAIVTRWYSDWPWSGAEGAQRIASFLAYACSLCAIWAAGFHASMAYSLWRVKTRAAGSSGAAWAGTQGVSNPRGR